MTTHPTNYRSPPAAGSTNLAWITSGGMSDETAAGLSGAKLASVRWVEMEIRPLCATDATALHRGLLGDPEVAAWFRSSGPFTFAECEEMVIRKVAHRVAHRFGWSLGWEDDTCVGWGAAQYCIVDGFSEVEIGWAVARSHWRRGIASRLGRHVLAEVGSLGLLSVVAYTHDDNVASRGVMAKLGMAYEKSFDLHGEPHVLYRQPLARS